MILYIIRKYLTKNRCYIKGETCPKIGIQIHTIGCGQGTAQSVADYWNQPALSACVHYCVDADTPGKVLQFLPEWIRSWADAGWGNDNLITIEICESDYIKYKPGTASYTVNNAERFKSDILRGYQTAVELCASICKRYGWNPKAKLPNGMYLISSHKEGNLAGLSSNHGDPNHVWDRFGLTMDGFRSDVAAAMRPEIKPGMVLRTTQRIPLRSGVSTAKKKAGYIKYKKLKSTVAKKKCRRSALGNAVMRVGKKFTVQEVKTTSPGNVWVRIKIGRAWMPICVGGKWRAEVV